MTVWLPASAYVCDSLPSLVTVSTLPSPQSTVKLSPLATVVLNLICSLADVVSHVVTKSPAGGVGVPVTVMG